MFYTDLGVIDISDTDSDSELLPLSSQFDYPPPSSQPASDVEVIEISSEEEQDEGVRIQSAGSGFYSPVGGHVDLSDDDSLSLPDVSTALSQAQTNNSAKPAKRDCASSFGSSCHSLTDGSPSKRSKTSNVGPYVSPDGFFVFPVAQVFTGTFFRIIEWE